MSLVIKWVGPLAASIFAVTVLVDGLRLYLADMIGPVVFWARSGWVVVFVYVWMRREMAVQRLFTATADLLAEIQRGKHTNV